METFVIEPERGGGGKGDTTTTTTTGKLWKDLSLSREVDSGVSF